MSPAESLRERVEAMHKPGHELTICNDTKSYPGKVLVAIRRPTFSAVLTIGASEWDALKCASACGWGLKEPQQEPATERAIAAVEQEEQKPKPRRKK